MARFAALYSVGAYYFYPGVMGCAIDGFLPMERWVGWGRVRTPDGFDDGWPVAAIDKK
jgi:hypothetical protein